MTPTAGEPGASAGAPGEPGAAGASDAADLALTARVVGVGPWPGGQAQWPDDPRYDPELLAAGDRRNVLEGYRYWRLAAIVADLDSRRAPLHVAIENLEHDFNIGSIVRTANAFNVAGVHVVGRRRWNRRGAMVTDRYLTVHHHPEPADLARWAAGAGVVVVGIDNVTGSTPLETEPLPRESVLVLGSEGPGLSPSMLAVCAQVRHITQYGSTRSMNAGAAGAIAMYAWAREHLAVPAAGAPAAGAPAAADGRGTDVPAAE